MIDKNIFEKSSLTLQNCIDQIYQKDDNYLTCTEMPIIMQKFGKTCMQILQTFNTTKIMDTIIPQKYTPDNSIEKKYQTKDQIDLSKFMTEPIWSLLNHGGKRMRPCLLVMIDQLSDNRNIMNALIVSGLVEILHTCSQIIDDIEDNSEKRRNSLTSHMIFGVDVAINSACFGYFKVLDIQNIIEDFQD